MRLSNRPRAGRPSCFDAKLPQGDFMRRLPFLVVTLALSTSALPALAQMGEPTPLALDLQKVPVGSWSEYTMTIGAGAGMTVKSRWALVARDANSNTLEMSAE